MRRELSSVAGTVELSRPRETRPNDTPQQLGQWFDKRDEDVDRMVKERTALAALKVRWIEHHKLTGHHPAGRIVPPEIRPQATDYVAS